MALPSFLLPRPDLRVKYWPGKSRNVHIVIGVVLVLSFAAWALGVAFQIITNALSTDRNRAREPTERPDGACIYFASSGMPMFATIATAIELILYSLGLLHPIPSLIWAILTLGGWITHIIFVLLMGIYDQCPCDMYILEPFANDFGLWEPVGLWITRMVLPGLAGVGSLVIIGYAGRAIDVRRKMKKAGKGDFSSGVERVGSDDA